MNDNSKIHNIILFGSIFIPTRQFLSTFKFRPWKGVYISNGFLESLDIANNLILNLLKTYKHYRIFPIIETKILTEDHLKQLKMSLCI